MAVFAHHIMTDMYVLHPMHNLKFVEDIVCGLNVNIALMATATFVMLSGATLALSGREVEPLSFYKKRLIRVLIPFYIAYIIYFFIRIVNQGTFRIFGGIPKWRFIFTIIGMDEYISAHGIRTFTLGVGEWFLGCIIICYLIYPFLYKVHRKFPIVTFIFMTVFNIVVNKYYDLLHLQIASYMNVVCQIYNFYLGIVLIDKKILSKISKKSLFFTIPVLFTLFVFKLPIYMNIKVTIAIAMVYITFYAFEDFISSIKPLVPCILFFNKISLEIFLVHHFIIYQVDYMIGYKRVGGVATLCIIILDLTLTILVSLFVEFLSRKVTSFMNERAK